MRHPPAGDSARPGTPTAGSPGRDAYRDFKIVERVLREVSKFPGVVVDVERVAACLEPCSAA